MNGIVSRLSALGKVWLGLAAGALALIVFGLAAPGSGLFFPLLSLWCNTALFALALLVLRRAGVELDLFHKAVLVGVWAVAALYFFWALGSRTFLYYWDYVNYILKQYNAEAAFAQSTGAGFRFLLDSITEDYTNFITLFTEFPFCLSGKTGDDYAFCQLFSVLPSLLVLLAGLVCKAGQLLRVKNTRWYFLIGFSWCVTFPFLRMSAMLGQPDWFGLIFAFMLLLLTLDYRFDRIDLPRYLLIFAATAGVILTRRWYLYFVVGYCFAYVLLLVVSSVRLAKSGQQSRAVHRLVRLAVFGLCAAGAIGGVTAGAGLGLLVTALLLPRRAALPEVRDVPPASSRVLRELLRTGIPITVGAAGMSLITLLDQALVTATLRDTLGYTTAETTALYGEYTFGMTLFMLPPSFIYPLSVSLMPAVSAALTRRDRTAAGIAAGAALKLTVLAALPAGVGLSVLAGPILQLLYPAVPETAEAAAYHLTFLGLACVFVCLMVATNGVLQSYGHPLLPVISLLCGGVLKIVTNYLMVGDPATGIRGAAVSTLYCYALIAVINLAAIARLVPERPGYISLFAKPVLLTAVMALAARSGYGLFCRLLPERWAVLPAVLLAAVVYVVLALAIGAVTRQDLQTLPKGEKLADRLHLR